VLTITSLVRTESVTSSAAAAAANFPAAPMETDNANSNGNANGAVQDDVTMNDAADEMKSSSTDLSSQPGIDSSHPKFKLTVALIMTDTDEEEEEEKEGESEGKRGKRKSGRARRVADMNVRTQGSAPMHLLLTFAFLASFASLHRKPTATIGIESKLDPLGDTSAAAISHFNIKQQYRAIMQQPKGKRDKSRKSDREKEEEEEETKEGEADEEEQEEDDESSASDTPSDIERPPRKRIESKRLSEAKDQLAEATKARAKKKEKTQSKREEMRKRKKGKKEVVSSTEAASKPASTPKAKKPRKSFATTKPSSASPPSANARSKCGVPEAVKPDPDAMVISFPPFPPSFSSLPFQPFEHTFAAILAPGIDLSTLSGTSKRSKAPSSQRLHVTRVSIYKELCEEYFGRWMKETPDLVEDESQKAERGIQRSSTRVLKASAKKESPEQLRTILCQHLNRSDEDRVPSSAGRSEKTGIVMVPPLEPKQHLKSLAACDVQSIRRVMDDQYEPPSTYESYLKSPPSHLFHSSPTAMNPYFDLFQYAPFVVADQYEVLMDEVLHSLHQSEKEHPILPAFGSRAASTRPNASVDASTSQAKIPQTVGEYSGGQRHGASAEGAVAATSDATAITDVTAASSSPAPPPVSIPFFAPLPPTPVWPRSSSGSTSSSSPPLDEEEHKSYRKDEQGAQVKVEIKSEHADEAAVGIEIDGPEAASPAPEPVVVSNGNASAAAAPSTPVMALPAPLAHSQPIVLTSSTCAYANHHPAAASAVPVTLASDPNAGAVALAAASTDAAVSSSPFPSSTWIDPTTPVTHLPPTSHGVGMFASLDFNSPLCADWKAHWTDSCFSWRFDNLTRTFSAVAYDSTNSNSHDMKAVTDIIQQAQREFHQALGKDEEEEAALEAKDEKQTRGHRAKKRKTECEDERSDGDKMDVDSAAPAAASAAAASSNSARGYAPGSPEYVKLSSRIRASFESALTYSIFLPHTCLKDVAPGLHDRAIAMSRECVQDLSRKFIRPPDERQVDDVFGLVVPGFGTKGTQVFVKVGLCVTLIHDELGWCSASVCKGKWREGAGVVNHHHLNIIFALHVSSSSPSVSTT
jgi:flagellar biosynthesis GTPase FlhF